MIEYLPRTFYDLNVKIIEDINWLSNDKLPVDMRLKEANRYVYKIFGVIYTEDTSEFRLAVSKAKTWETLAC